MALASMESACSAVPIVDNGMRVAARHVIDISRYGEVPGCHEGRLLSVQSCDGGFVHSVYC